MLHDFMTELYIADQAVHLMMEMTEPPKVIEPGEMLQLTCAAVDRFNELEGLVETVVKGLLEMAEQVYGDKLYDKLVQLRSQTNVITLDMFARALCGGKEYTALDSLGVPSCYGWLSDDLSDYLLDDVKRKRLYDVMPKVRMLVYPPSRCERGRANVID